LRLHPRGVSVRALPRALHGGHDPFFVAVDLLRTSQLHRHGLQIQGSPRLETRAGKLAVRDRRDSLESAVRARPCKPSSKKNAGAPLFFLPDTLTLHDDRDTATRVVSLRDSIAEAITRTVLGE